MDQPVTHGLQLTSGSGHVGGLELDAGLRHRHLGPTEHGQL
jgi:hypothetical protein